MTWNFLIMTGILILVSFLLGYLFFAPEKIEVNEVKPKQRREARFIRPLRDTERDELVGAIQHRHHRAPTEEEIDAAHVRREEHIQKCGNLDDTPIFNAALFNDPKYIKYQNCYFFAMNDLNRTYKGKPQPLTYYHPD